MATVSAEATMGHHFIQTTCERGRKSVNTIHGQRFDRFLERHGIVEKRGPEIQAAFEVFKERTEGFLDVAWHKCWTPEKLKEAFEQYGFDCYSQGCVDGATTVKMRPELIEFMRAAESEEAEHG